MNRKQKALRISAFLGTVGVSATLIAAGVGATGAYFSDTKAGTISGTLGSIKVSTGHTQISFSNMLPGELQTVSDGYTNTGRNAEDVWIVFNTDAAHALNDLGTYGEAHFASNGTEIFASQNLNDHPSCPPGSSDATHPPCAALPTQIKLADNLAPGASGDWSFGFKYASKLSSAFNLDTAGPWNPSSVNGTIGSGLPYQIVATQHGISPGA